METILLFVRIVLAVIFALAGIGKLLDLAGSEKAVKGFGIPENLAKPFSIALPIAELFFALLLLFTSTAWLGAIGAFLLLAVFIGGMIWQMAQGNAPDCHCFGAIHSEPVSLKSLIRNGVFAIFALFLIAQGRESQGLSFADLTNEMAIQLFLGLAMVALLGAAVYFLKKISEQQTQIMRRIEILELTGFDGRKTVEREEAKSPQEGLLVGSVAPDFELPDLNGKEVSLQNLLTAAKLLLMFFVSPTCSPCAALLPEIENWQTEFKDQLNFVFISSGKAKENAEKLGSNTFKQVLLQNEREIAETFGANWTPTALLVNADGTIASRPAVGDAAIRELIEKIKIEIIDNQSLYITGDGQKIGTEIPAFALSSVDGNSVKAEDLRGKKTLLTYWSIGCGFCTQMLDELREWDKAKGQDEPNLLLVSSGDAEANREMNLLSPVVLDDKREIAEKLGMNGTPSAVLIDENGKIISEVAVGAPQIWTLIGKKK
ncbi:MAG: redoxin domain-containing protein [Pyrinomonadaceae bacterium]